MKKTFFLLLASLSTIVAVRAKGEYEGLFDDRAAVATSQSDFITLRKSGQKLWFEIPLKYMGREMLLASTLSDISSGEYGSIGHKVNPPLHIRFTLQDSTVHMRQVNSSLTTNAVRKALDRVNGDPILYTYPIAAWSPDRSAVVVEMTDLFLDNPDRLNFLSDPSITPTFKKESSSLDEIKAFDDNLSVCSTLTFGVSTPASKSEEPLTAKVTRSLLLLPEEKMTPRLSDSRVGVFATNKVCFDDGHSAMRPYSVANRWRVVPSDIEAYSRGERVEPAKKIVWYVDDAFPEAWKDPIKRGIERWNKAFEAIGFRNVVEARDFPTPQQDPAFDPDNLKYSCVRYLPSSTVNAMGPSWVDPSTGEIINASVIVWSNIIDLVNKWRFVQTAQADPRVRTRRLPDDIIGESLEYIIAHEVGHTMGFAHNMASSAAWPVDSLRSATFTQKYGTTPSIMDYARYNYVAQPSDHGVRLTPPDLGVYDYFLVEWTYRYLPGFANEWDEAPTVESWVDAVAGDPVYRYGRQQMGVRYDPHSIEEDLGDDPMRASDYGIKNLKYILPNLERWIVDDPDYDYRRQLYNEINSQYFRYVHNVMMNIGGIVLTEVKEGTRGTHIAPVPRDVQKASLGWVMNQYRNMEWLDLPWARRSFPLGVTGSPAMREKVANDFKAQIANVILSSYYSDTPYGIGEFMDDLYAETWRNLLARRAPSVGDRMLQKTMVDMFCEPLSDSSKEEALTTFAPQVEFGPAGMGFQSEVDISTIDNSEDHLTRLAIRSRNLLQRAVRRSRGDTKAHYQALLIKLNTALKGKI